MLCKSIKMSKTDIIIATLSVLLLSIIVCFPVLNDISIFYSGGIKILEGKTLYTDWIDIKSPAIYYFFAGIISVFGRSEMAVRSFDFLYQLITIFSLFYFVFKIFKNQRIASIACLLYSIIYVVTNHYSTMQVETFTILPFIWSTYLFLKDNNKSANIFYSGLLFGLACGFKYTLAFGFLGYLIYTCSAIISTKLKIKNLTIFFISGVLGLLITSIPLLDPQVRIGYFQSLDYLKHYTVPISTLKDLLQFSVTTINIVYSNHYSIPITALSIYGLVHMMKSIELRNIFKLLFFMAVGFMLSIFIENKFSLYHFSRVLFIYVIFAGYGCYFFIEDLNLFKRNDKFTKAILWISILPLLYLSPAPRLINVIMTNINHVFYTDKYDKAYKFLSQDVSTGLIFQYKTMCNYINSHANKNDTYMVINSFEGSFPDRYIHLTDKNYIFAQSYFCNSVYNYQPYYKKYVELIKNSNWLLVANTKEAYKPLISDSTTKQILDHSFCLVTKSNDLFLYKKIN